MRTASAFLSVLDDAMNTFSTARIARPCALLLAVASVAGCAILGADEARDSGGSAAQVTVAPKPAPDKPAAPSPVAGEGSDKKPESARIFLGSGTMVRTPPPERVAAEPADITLNFEAADVREIAKTVLADIFGVSYIVDPKVQGTISFRSAHPLPRSALLPTLETVLRMNGIVLVKENGIYKILPAAAARGSLSPRLGRTLPGFNILVMPLKFVGAREMAKILEPFAPDASAVKADEMRNLMILSGTQNEIQHMLDTIEMFDVDWLSGMSVGLFTLQNADVKTLDAELGKILGDKGQNPLAGIVRLIPIERLNAFVIITPQPHYLEQAKIWLERLDRAGGTGGTRLFVYQVQNGKAEHLAELLNQTFGGGKGQTTRSTGPAVAPGLAPTDIRSTGSTGTGSSLGTGISGITGLSLGTSMVSGTSTAAAAPTAPRAAAPITGTTLTVAGDSSGPGGDVRIVADTKNNALLILTNAAGYEKIEAALKKLDTAPRQVLIEVTIAEVSLKDELKYGIEWLFTNGSRRSGKLDLGAAGLNSIVPGFSYAITSAADGSVKSVLNALASDNKLNILSSPHIMVADNQTAKIQVGDSVPIAGPQTVAATGVVVTSVQYLDTGVILSVTPSINAGGLVNLDINQEVSTASSTTTSGLNSPTISKRSAKTIVTVQSGDTMVLGGLISEKSTNDNTGLPFLSSIPILGGLFGTQSRDRSRTELIVLITPRVATNVGQTKQISEEFRRKLKEAGDLLDCGTSNSLGYTSRGGWWCLQPNRFEGKTDRQMDEKK